VFFIVTVAVNVAPAATEEGTDWLTKAAPLASDAVVGVGVGVRVAEGVEVAVRVGVNVGRPVGVRVGVNVTVGVGVGVGVALGVGVRVGVPVPTAVAVRAGVPVGTGVPVGVGVAFGSPYVYAFGRVPVCPSGFLTTTSTIPAACAPESPASWVALVQTTFVVATPPRNSFREPARPLATKFAPLTVTRVPPPIEPEPGLTEFTRGAGTAVGVGVPVGKAVGLFGGVPVVVGVGVLVGAAVGVLVGVLVGVSVGPPGVRVGVPVGVTVGVTVRVGVTVGLGVGVEVRVAPALTNTVRAALLFDMLASAWSPITPATIERSPL
jgi:hypothetical protein